MRVVHVVTVMDNEASYGGPVSVAIAQCKELRRRGHDARIATVWRDTSAPPSAVEGVPLISFRGYRLHQRLRHSSLTSPAMVRWLSTNRRLIDVAHIHMARDLVPMAAALLLRNCRVPYVIQTHGMIGPDDRRMARLADGLAVRSAINEAAAAFVLTESERRSIELVPGVDRQFKTLGNCVEVQTDLPERPERSVPEVLFLGRLHPYKGVMVFAEAANQIIKSGLAATFRVVGPDAGELTRLTGYVKAHPNLAKALVYEGSLPHSLALQRLAQADLCALPSVLDNFPMVLLEALSLGIPTVSSTRVGIASLLREREACLLSEPQPPKVAQAIGRLIDDRSLRQRIAENAKRTVREEFSAAAVVGLLEAEYRLAVAKSREAIAS